ncbi:MAG: hypothetical protein Q9201_000662 [Fulgogasparrea decipioides]
MDALKSFTHLTDNIPDWLAKVDDLAIQVAEQHTRFARLSQTHFPGFRLSKKHDSTESLRPPKDGSDDPNTSVPPKDISPTSQPAVNNTLIVSNIRRKRKSDSADLSGASGPQRYRTRSMVIVYYDSAIQEAFEALVRCIAGARNNLRKGKTAASFKARMASMGMGDDDDDDDGYPILNPKLMVKRVPGEPSPSTSPSFDQADADLEAAQNLCEVAAHQFLRDGDCGEELAGTRKRFEDCLEVAKKEVERLQVEDKPGLAETVESPSRARKPAPGDSNPIVLAAEKVQAPRIPTVPTLTTSGTIEVDNDSDGSSVHIDLSAFRRTRRV